MGPTNLARSSHTKGTNTELDHCQQTSSIANTNIDPNKKPIEHSFELKVNSFKSITCT